jgi:hypothetical protein
MLTSDQINELHRLYWAEHWPIRRIEQRLKISFRTLKKYLAAPAQKPARRERVSKLDPFKAVIAEFLNQTTKLWDSHAAFRRNWRRANFTAGSR